GGHAIVSGKRYGDIVLADGASIEFTNPWVKVGSITMKKGRTDTTKIMSANGNNIIIQNELNIAQNCIINPQEKDLTFYVNGGLKPRVKVRANNTIVNANINIPNGRITVGGGGGTSGTF